VKPLLNKLWLEPAAFIGLVVTLGLLVLNILGDTDWSVETIIEIAAPLITGLGIRQLVVPTPKAAAGDVPAQPAGTTYRRDAEKDRL
jgi:hypothetical protein